MIHAGIYCLIKNDATHIIIHEIDLYNIVVPQYSDSSCIFLTLANKLQGALHPEMPKFNFFISRYFYNLNFKYVHIQRSKTKFKKKSSMGVRDFSEHLKIRRLQRKGYGKKLKL